MTKIQKISKEEFDNTKLTAKEMKSVQTSPLLTEKDVEAIKKSLDQPVEIQKQLAAKLKLFIDYKMEKELKEWGYLSDNLRKWVTTYNEMLDQIQKSLYGQKSQHLHLHKVSHSVISAEMRKYRKIKKVEEVDLNVQVGKDKSSKSFVKSKKKKESTR